MPNRRDNLYKPVDGLHRTARRFIERALDSTPGLSSERVGQLLTAAAVSVAIMLVALRNEAGPSPAGAGQGPSFDSMALKTGNC